MTVPASHFPSPLDNATSDRLGERATATGESAHRAQHAGANKPAFGLDPLPLLEGGDGADAGRAAVLWKNNIRERDRCECSAANLAALLTRLSPPPKKTTFRLIPA